MEHHGRGGVKNVNNQRAGAKTVKYYFFGLGAVIAIMNACLLIVALIGLHSTKSVNIHSWLGRDSWGPTPP